MVRARITSREAICVSSRGEKSSTRSKLNVASALPGSGTFLAHCRPIGRLNNTESNSLVYDPAGRQQLARSFEAASYEKCCRICSSERSHRRHECKRLANDDISIARIECTG